jgi:AcrR family transcriptional regulator
MRERLVDEASAHVAEHGVDALSVRTLAAVAGTSTAAIYTLFGGKPGLFAAMHERAFRRFGARQAAVGESDDPVEDVVRLGLAYRQSALDDPSGYQIMFGSQVHPHHATPELLDAAADTFMPLLEAVRRCVEGGRFRTDLAPESIATALWANVHGLVSLELRQISPPQAGDPARVFETAVRATVRGWTAAST